MATAKDLFAVSKQLLDHLNSYDADQKERENFISEIDEWLEKRQRVIDHMPRELGEEDRKLGPYLIEADREINEKLEQIMGDIKSDRKTLKKKKQKNRQYVHPFGGVSKDGMFLDKRK